MTDAPFEGAHKLAAANAALRTFASRDKERRFEPLAADATAFRWWLGFAVIAAILVAPLFIVQLPPLLDYPNHLARSWALAAGQKIPVVAQMYAPAWGFKPYLAIDAIMHALLQFLPLFTAGKVQLALALLLPVASTAVYSRVLFGRRSYWPLTSCLLAYGTFFLLGFTNFIFAMSLAFFSAALWIAERDKHPVAACIATAVLAIACFLAHLFGLLILMVLVGGYELDWLWRRWSDRTLTPAMFTRRLRVAVAVFVVPFTAGLLFAAQAAHGPPEYQSLRQVFARLPLAFYSYDRWFDLALAVALVGFMVWACWRGHLRVPRITVIQLVVFAVAYLALPWGVAYTGYVSARFIYAASFLLFAGMMPQGLPRRVGSLALTLIAGVFLMRMTTVGEVWHFHRHELASFEHVIAPVGPGSKVLVAMGPHTSHAELAQLPLSCRIGAREQTCMHMAALLLIERHAFWASLFANPTQVPIEVRPPYKALASVQGGVPPVAALSAPHLTPRQLWIMPNLPGWQHKYDYLLLFYPNMVPDSADLLPGTLKLVDRTKLAALYRIETAPPSPALKQAGN